ncbi:hypothetical protein Cni_G07506 [Canna indica]|uniref:Uncharacterized protein n=1 Tax=Canna indica TaxID=4628 RepID=A0AAQ3JYL1_9LILI|nr:hypothetical protein Cni_G07506 [Canna indica]
MLTLCAPRGVRLWMKTLKRKYLKGELKMDGPHSTLEVGGLDVEFVEATAIPDVKCLEEHAIGEDTVEDIFLDDAMSDLEDPDRDDCRQIRERRRPIAVEGGGSPE